MKHLYLNEISNLSEDFLNILTKNNEILTLELEN
jgi:hypothetical protein